MVFVNFLKITYETCIKQESVESRLLTWNKKKKTLKEEKSGYILVKTLITLGLPRALRAVNQITNAFMMSKNIITCFFFQLKQACQVKNYFK